MQLSNVDLPALVKALNSEPELRYVLVGGLAVMVQGGARITLDADIAIAFDPDNRRRIVSALAPLHPRPVRLAAGAAWEWDEKCVRAPWSVFMTDAGRVDLLIRLPGVDSFDGLLARSDGYDVEGQVLRVASIDDLLAMKSVADRDRDRDDYNQLLAIKRMREEQASEKL